MARGGGSARRSAREFLRTGAGFFHSGILAVPAAWLLGPVGAGS